MTQTCANCSALVSEEDAFCQSCGTRVEAALPSYQPRPMIQDQVAPVVAAVPGWNPEGVVLPGNRMPPTRSVNAAAGPAEGNTTYAGMRLAYEVTSEPSFDPLGSPRYLAQLGLRGAIYWFIFAFSLPLMLLIGFLLPIIGIVIDVAFIIFLLCCFWFLKVPIKFSEWKFTVDGKAGAAPEVLDHIAWVLQQRGTPLTSLTVRRLQPPAGVARDYLELRTGKFYGYITCFPYGADLYVGWTFWSQASPFQYLIMIIVHIWHTIFNRANDLYISLSFDTIRALRETMHSATREGTDVAIGRLQAQGRGLIASGAIQVQEIRESSR
jgi:hypothetical protein